MPTKRQVLDQLKRDELIANVEYYELPVSDRRVRALLIEALASSRRARLAEILEDLPRARLKEICRDLGLDETGRAKAVLVERLTGKPRTPAVKPEPPMDATHQISLWTESPETESPETDTTATPAHETEAPAETKAAKTKAAPESPPLIPPRGHDEPATARRPSREPAEPPTSLSLLRALNRARLVAVARDFGVALTRKTTPERTRDELARALLDTGRVSFGELLRSLGRDELKAACRAHGLDDSGRSRAALAARLAEATSETVTDEPVPLFGTAEPRRFTPRVGDVVQARQRQYLVDAVAPPPEEGHTTRVGLVCLDDDQQGRRLEVLWELELGARVLQPEAHGLGRPERLDPPRHFAAYLYTLKWNAVTATRARLFQAPFRAGIHLFNHQLTPLRKALELPRANLLIADDVGLGKTIEAALVIQELRLRQRLDMVLIVCPAAICLQWRKEMAHRFGLHFEIMNRDFVARRRRERGFGVNPWDTHNRFVISYHTLRRPEYRDPLLQHLTDRDLGDRARKSLLVLDEAHTAAPASASKYAVDSQVTRMVRSLAKRFENRLFLTATPHNGHSNSFSALLEILDPQRFTRGVPIAGPTQLDAVMVRRLKKDLLAMGTQKKLPHRRVIEIALHDQDGAWRVRYNEEDRTLNDIALDRNMPAVGETGVELRLSELLADYTELASPKRGRGRLPFIRLQQRLLSSVEAFARTLARHRKTLGNTETDANGTAPHSETPKPGVSLRTPGFPGTLGEGAMGDDFADADEYGLDDETAEAADDHEVETASRLVRTPGGRARALLDQMHDLAERHRGAPDAKVLALLEWIRRHQCAAARVGGAAPDADRSWSGRRVIVFTEFGATLTYLHRILTTAIDGTDQGHQRILKFVGGMLEDSRDKIQSAFNAPPDEHPVRILLATDAAREGVNLQGHCADLFHYDVPWNPARMEQRNGRIDRTLQNEPEVRCHYFTYPERREDLVLRKLVDKVETIQDELGSLSTVVFDRVRQVMDRGIAATTAGQLDEAEKARGTGHVRRELETSRSDVERLRHEIDEAGAILDASRNLMDFDPRLLRDAVDVGLELSGLPRLSPISPEEFQLPDMPDSWQETLDTLRPPRERDEPFWEWRRRAPLPVIFRPAEGLDAGRVHLHLEHPFVRRILSRFLAQGYSAHDLSRVTVLTSSESSQVRVIAFGRLSIFGPGATRLHDELIPVAARWLESRGEGHLKPFSDRTDRKMVDRLDRILRRAPDHPGVSDTVAERLADSAPEDFATLWPHIRDEADSKALEAVRRLAERGAEEAQALRRILEDQRDAIDRELGRQLLLFTDSEADQKEQFEHDRKYMERRRGAIEQEIETEPAQLEELYQVALKRLEPVGLVYLWPETRA